MDFYMAIVTGMDCSKNIFDSIFTNVEADNYKSVYLTNIFICHKQQQ